MKKYSGIRFNSKWDGSTWAILALVAVCCLLPMMAFDGEVGLPIAICAAMLIVVVVAFKSIYYRIDGDRLIVYQMFIPSVYPIDKISEICPTKSILSAPATSLTDRIAIKFSDRKVLKCSMPLVISPVNKAEFVDVLLKVNPEIKVSVCQ